MSEGRIKPAIPAMTKTMKGLIAFKSESINKVAANEA
jgi:hypothetical protein